MKKRKNQMTNDEPKIKTMYKIYPRIVKVITIRLMMIAYKKSILRDHSMI